MSLKKNWRILATEGARKEIKRLPERDRVRIEQAIDTMEDDPFEGDIRKLGGDGDVWRRRVGSYRILFKILSEERIIFIREVARRTSSTY